MRPHDPAREDAPHPLPLCPERRALPKRRALPNGRRLARQLGGGGTAVEVLSAGSAPAEAMREIAIGLSARCPRTGEMIAGVDLAAAMGCGGACPVLPGVRCLDWQLDDPAGKPLEQVRPIRGEIKRRVQDLLGRLLA